MKGTIPWTAWSKVWTLCQSWLSGSRTQPHMQLLQGPQPWEDTRGRWGKVWWLLCVTFSESSPINVHRCFHGICSLFRTQVGTFPPLKAHLYQWEDEGWAEALQQREEWSRAMRGQSFDTAQKRRPAWERAESPPDLVTHVKPIRVTVPMVFSGLSHNTTPYREGKASCG